MSKQFTILFYFLVSLFLSNSLRLFAYDKEIIKESKEDKDKISFEENQDFLSKENHQSADLNLPKHIKELNSNEASIKDLNYISTKKQANLSEENIEIKIEQKDNKKLIVVGRYGVIYFVTSYNDNEKNIFNINDIEEKTSFNTSFFAENSYYDVICRLWKLINGQIRVFCRLKTIQEFQSETSYLESSTFTYDNKYTIKITSEILSTKIIQVNEPIPFLYADKQILNINENEEGQILNLKFKQDIYNNDILLLAGNWVNTKILDECQIERKELICKISVEDIEEILSENNGNLKLMSYNQIMATYYFPNVFDIEINFIDYEKQNIYVGITKLLENAYEKSNYIVYETNVTSITNLISEDFTDIQNLFCFFKKDSRRPLLLLCEHSNSGTYALGEIKEAIILDNINVKYNFIILPVINDEKYEISDQLGSHVFNAFPSLLNFSLYDEITIEILLNNPRSSNIRLNLDENDLKCENFGEFIKMCNVTKSHFENYKSGYYNLYHFNHLNKFSIFYEVPPFKVILPQNNTIILRIKKSYNINDIKIGKEGTLYFVTNYNDWERNIFDNNEIIEDASFKSTIIDSDENKYVVFCKLWNTIDDYVRIFCELNKKLKYSIQNITLANTSINYGQYQINIVQEEYLQVEQFDYYIPFLFSLKQSIDLNDVEQEYNLTFSFKSYNSELLYLYGQYNNYAALDKCSINDKEINCEISKNNLKELLVSDNEIFKIGVIHDNIGIISYDCILDININYKNIKKENIYINILSPIYSIGEKNNPLGYETNITTISNLITKTFFQYFYLKKTKGKFLILYLKFEEEFNDYIINYFNEITTLNDIHYKYNFIFEPYKGTDKVSFRGDGTDIKLVYPEQLDFTKKDIFTLKFIMTNPSYSEKIKLNLNSSELECKNLKELKICNISLKHFTNEQNGNYLIYHYNKLNGYLFYQDSSIINVILPKNIIDIYIKSIDNNEGINLGKNGLLYFVTNYTDNTIEIFDTIDIEEKTEVDICIIDKEQMKYDANCRLWKAKNEKIRIFCKLKENQNIKGDYIKLSDYVIYYKDYTINIISNDDFIKINKIDQELPFLYSDNQIINIAKTNNNYYLFVKIWEYNNQLLLLSNKENNNYYIILENCTIVTKYLKCEISKGKLEEILYDNNQIFTLSYYDNNIQTQKFNSVFDILVNYNIQEKENISVEINKLKEGNININNYFAYETNISNFTNIYTKQFIIESNDQIQFLCFFKKKFIDTLLLVCSLDKEGNYSLGEIDQEISLTNINVKYNFILNHINNKEQIKVKNSGNSLIFAYPMVVDFYLNDQIIIDYYMTGTDNSLKIKLNPNSSDLECYESKQIDDSIFSKKCIVPKSHFIGKQTGYYYTYHYNQIDEYIIFYELSPIQIILPKENEIVINILRENNKNILQLGPNGVFVFVTNYNDNKINIFNPTELKNENIKFNSTVIDDNKNQYEVNCRLWQPIDENIRIFCKLNKNLNHEKINITLIKTIFEYNKYRIIINQDKYIEVKQYDFDIPLLYSDQVQIDITSNTQKLPLKFKAESYNNDILYIYGQNNNYAILENCKINNEELLCELANEKLQGLFLLNNTKFKIGAINDNIGIIPFDNILDIILINNVESKKSINIEIKKLITAITEVGVYYGFEANQNLDTDLSYSTDYMDDIFEKCFIKKYKETPAYILCKSSEENNTFIFNDLIEEKIYTNIHQLYNFRIQPFNISEKIAIKDHGTDIKLTYPETLDYTNNDSIIIRYIMNDPSLAKNIKLNPDETDLNCENLNGLKKCFVSKAHFLNHILTNYRTLHSNHEGESSIYYESSVIKVILPEEDIIKIFIKDEDNNQEINIGKSGIIYFITNYTDKVEKIFNDNNLEDKTEFKATLSDNNFIKYDAACRLWQPINDKLRIFCKLNESLSQQSTIITLDSTILNYNNHKIAIINQMNFGIKINQLNTNIPFIYYDIQNINVVKEKDLYEIKLRVLEYNNEQLILFNKEQEFGNVIFYEYNYDGKEIIYKINKSKIEEILAYSGQIFKLKYLDYNVGELFKFNNVFNIIINYNSIKKENLYIGIRQISDYYLNAYSYFTLIANISEVSDIISNSFIMSSNDESEVPCFFKKNQEHYLLILCKVKKSGEFSLGKINKEIKLENINIKYNFLIQPDKDTYSFYFWGKGGSILFVTPSFFDFYINDSYIINFYSKENKDLFGIKLELNNRTEIKCININKIKSCNVTRYHFADSTAIYYYIYHLFEKSSSYKYYNNFHEVSPIIAYVPYSDEQILRINNINNKNGIIIGQKGYIVLITDYEDTNKRFNPSDMEKETFYEAIFSGEKKNYNAGCYLWKPEGEKIRLICKFEENLEDEKIKLNRYIFTYGRSYIRVAVFFEDYLNIKQLKSTASFLYSDKQDINITEKSDEYELKFRKGIYNKQPLMLYSKNKNNKYIYLNCNEETKELNCKIKKDNLLEILSYSGEKYFLSQMTDTEGVLNFDGVFEININYDNIVKKDVFINITKIIDMNAGYNEYPLVEKNSYVIFETNITDIPKISTNYFNIETSKNLDNNCLFKKSNNHGDDKLLILCEADAEGNYSLKINEDIYINNASIIYNFIIVADNQLFEYMVQGEKGTKVLSAYPETLDYTSIDTLTIKYQTENPEKLETIKLNIDSDSELKCINRNQMKECIVPRDHFKQSGYYETYHNNSFGIMSKFYEIPKIYVKYEKAEDEEDDSLGKLIGIIIGSVVGGLILIGIIIFLIVRSRKKRAINENKISSDFPGKSDFKIYESKQIELTKEEKEKYIEYNIDYYKDYQKEDYIESDKEYDKK